MANIIKVIRASIGYAASNARPNIASAATLELTEDASSFVISGNATITSLSGSRPIRPGRVVRFTGGTGAAVVFTNTNDTVVKGQMDLGGANITLGAQDVLQLEQQETGAWVIVSIADN